MISDRHRPRCNYVAQPERIAMPNSMPQRNQYSVTPPMRMVESPIPDGGKRKNQQDGEVQ